MFQVREGAGTWWEEVHPSDSCFEQGRGWEVVEREKTPPTHVSREGECGGDSGLGGGRVSLVAIHLLFVVVRVSYLYILTEDLTKADKLLQSII